MPNIFFASKNCQSLELSDEYLPGKNMNREGRIKYVICSQNVFFYITVHSQSSFSFFTCVVYEGTKECRFSSCRSTFQVSPFLFLLEKQDIICKSSSLKKDLLAHAHCIHQYKSTVLNFLTILSIHLILDDLYTEILRNFFFLLRKIAI